MNERVILNSSYGMPGGMEYIFFRISKKIYSFYQEGAWYINSQELSRKFSISIPKSALEYILSRINKKMQYFHQKGAWNIFCQEL